VAHLDDVRAVYTATAARLVSQVYALTGDFAEAQDVVQEAFARALVHQRRFAELDNPQAWLRTVAINLARSYGRRRALLDRLVRSGRLDRPGRTVPGLSPDHVALVAALQRLKRPEREAVVLHYLADLPVAEVAASLGCSVSAVKMRLRRGRQALAELLDEHAGRELHHA
jgi:RNA polymerase sigma-70 factor (ECF subfamily)